VAIDLPPGPRPGLEYDWTITVSNNGPADATDVELDSVLPAGFSFGSNSGDCTSGYPCLFATIPAGSSRTVTTRACVARDYSGPDPVVFEATVDATTNDPVASNNSAIANVPLVLSVFADGFDCPSP
jgi:uncharacterized repeat protein (TIGR01451 family)